ncbi:putative gustatory receptor 59d [Drosophila bipectinata]|uniref:putative gustatory receptor 59d n=1 Tax=Drosophila bipectinata TaxID=42026 RepID=UPI001C8A81B0|nr:putative gustatory receptor 59d [Drosophila bipectinata]
MANVVKLFLLIAYWYGRLIGAINYEIDLKTGRTRTTKKATIYAACIQLLNEELKAVIAEVQSLIPRRRGVFVTKCCYLADQLDEIARTQSYIQELTRHISKVYDVQTFCVAITTYLNIIGGLYTMFCMGKANNFTNNVPPIILALAAPCIILFYVDIVLNNWRVFRLLDAHKEMVGLLQQRTLFQHGLDPRLELTFESFQLNLARNPFKIMYCSVLECNRFASFSIYNSLMTNAILLIQYDMQNY